MEFELREANYNTLQRRLSGWTRLKPFEVSAWAMYGGDHWDSGRGYIGPYPMLDDPERDKVLSLILRAFTSRNIIKETTDRAIDGLVSRSPNWKVYNQKELISRAIQDAQVRADNSKRSQAAEESIDQTANAKEPKFVKKEVDAKNALAIKATDSGGNISITEANDQGSSSEPKTVNSKEIEAEILLGKLWTDLNLKQVLTDVLTERLVTGRGCARVYVPKKYINDDGSVKSVDGLLGAVKAVRAEKVSRDRAKLIDDEGDKISVVRLEKSKSKETKIQTLKGIEISFVNDDDGKTYLAVFEPENQKPNKKNTTPPTELNGDDNTDVSKVIEELQKNADVSTGFFLDGQLFAEEIVGTPLITEQLLQNNRALNLDLTLGVNVLIEGGFSEMITTNAAIAYEEVADPANVGKTIKKAKNLTRGASMSQNVIGVQTFDAQGNKSYESPSVNFRTPTPLSTFKDGEELYYKQCLSEVKQLFVLISSDAMASGESRIQARQDFLNEILRFKAEVDMIGGWLMTALLHLTASLAGKDGYFEGLGIVFDARVTAGDLSADEKNVVITRYEKHLISRENAMVLLGSEDPLLEIDSIRADIAEQMDDNVRRAAAMSRFSNAINADKQTNPTGGENPPKTVKKGAPNKK